MKFPVFSQLAGNSAYSSPKIAHFRFVIVHNRLGIVPQFPGAKEPYHRDGFGILSLH
jgi:hypothetical protein